MFNLSLKDALTGSPVKTKSLAENGEQAMNGTARKEMGNVSD